MRSPFKMDWRLASVVVIRATGEPSVSRAMVGVLFIGLLVVLVWASLFGLRDAPAPDSVGAPPAPETPPLPAPTLDSSYRMTSHRAVLITEDELIPRIVTLDEGQLIAWISYSAAESIIVFDRDTARGMICHSLVKFSFAGEELRSQPIRAGEFASFCQLQPGRYRYRVVSPQRDAAALTGEIIVGSPALLD